MHMLDGSPIEYFEHTDVQSRQKFRLAYIYQSILNWHEMDLPYASNNYVHVHMISISTEMSILITKTCN